MLIRFSLSIDALEALTSEEIEMPFSELLRAHRNGCHLFVVERDVADYLSQRIELSNQDKALLRRLHHEFTQLGRLHERATTYIEISVPGEKPVRRGRCLRLPLDLISYRTFGGAALLLTENARFDGRLIRFVLRCVRDVSRGPSFSFEDVHGGGASIVDGLVEALDARNVGICVLDTDRRSPFSDVCAVTKKAINTSAKSDWPLFVVVPLPCHELENVIPHEVIMMMQSSIGCKWNSMVSRIKEWESKGSKREVEAFWLFFDVKEGLSSDEILSLSKDGREWIGQRLNVAGAFSGEWRYSGYGSSVVPQLLEDNRALDEIRKRIREPTWWKVFGEVFSDIVWFGAASKRLNT